LLYIFANLGWFSPKVYFYIFKANSK
jgi:hypothetical protein